MNDKDSANPPCSDKVAGVNRKPPGRRPQPPPGPPPLCGASKTDLDTLKAAFAKIGVHYEVSDVPETEVGVEWRREPGDAKKSLTIAAGRGYSGVFTAFYFNKDGGFLSQGCWE